MSSTESKLAFKSKVFRLAGLRDHGNESDGPYPPNTSESEIWSDDGYISPKDPYWSIFWDHPEYAEDVYALLSFNDIKFIRSSNKPNFLNWIRVLTTKLITIATSKNFPDNSEYSSKRLLNCVRFLNLIIPFLLEKPELSSDTNSVFWNLNYDNIGVNHHMLSGITNSATIGSYPNSNDDDSSLSASSLKVNIKQSNGRRSDSANAEVGKEEPSKTLGEQLISVLVDLLFTRGFTIEENGVKGLDYKIWEVGIGLNGKYNTPNPALDSNRFEILRLMITLSSNGLYSSPKEVVQNGSRFLSVLVSSTPRLKFSTLLCSLLNTICRSCKTEEEKNGLSYSSPENNNQYSTQKYYDLRKTTITYSLQLLTIMLVYPIPTNDIAFIHSFVILPKNEKPYNRTRVFLGKIAREAELNFIYNSIFSLITRPMEQSVENEANPFSMIKNNFNSNSPNINNSNNSVFGSSFPALPSWSIEIFVLLWELVQCNKQFKIFVFTKKVNEIVVVLLYYIRFYKNDDQWKHSLIRIICYFMLYLTSDENVLKRLLLPVDLTFYSKKLPNFYKVGSDPPSNFTYRDFVIYQISDMLINDEFDILVSPNFFEYLYNLIPIKTPEEKAKAPLSHYSCLSILKVISKFSTEEVLKDPLKMDLLALIIRSMANSICRYHTESRTLLFIITKHEKLFQRLLSLVETSEFEYELNDIKEEGEEDEDNQLSKLNTNNNSNSATGVVTPVELEDTAQKTDIDAGIQFVKEIEKSLRPKLPAGMSLKAKSKLPIDAPLSKVWAGYRGLLVILEAVKIVKKEVPEFENLKNSETIETLVKIENIRDFSRRIGRFAPTEFSPKQRFEQLRFTWSNISLGWYESILWGSLFYESLIHSRSGTGSAWFNNRNPSRSLKDVASSWGFNWKSAKEKHIEFFQFDAGILRLNTWNGTEIKLFKIKESASDKPLVDVSTLMKRFRLNSTASLNTIDSRSSLNSPTRKGSQSGLSSPNQLTPINSRQSFGTPRNSLQLNISRQNSYQ